MGDEAWKEMRARHDELIRRDLEEFDGREVKQTGDGFLATFDGAARAVECAEDITEAMRDLGLELRIGLHTGECELIGDDITGLAVNIAARVGGLAQGSEILVSRTVRDLVAGSDLRFLDAGTHNLKGVPGEWQVFRVDRPELGSAAIPDARQPSATDRIARGAVRHAPGAFRAFARLRERRRSSPK